MPMSDRFRERRSSPLLPPLPSWPRVSSSSSAKEENHNRLQQQRKYHVRDLYEEEGHSERYPRIFDEDDILDTRYIPWNRFPDISRLRVFRKNHLDRGDGERFTADEFDQVESLLFHVCRDLSLSCNLTDHQTRQITHLGGMGRICLILDLIEQRQLLRDFIRLEITDYSLPLLLPKLQGMLYSLEDGERAAERFFTEQFRAVSRNWSNGAHHVMHRREALPFRPLRSIGFGSQGSIDEVQLPNTEGTCARKRWIASANLRKITARFDDEVKIIKKVAAHPHILELLASYTRGREFGLLLPVADCDLWHILTMNPSEREDIIPNQRLIQSWGCLSSGLLFMHDKGIKHKDIKPQNIVLRRGDFQFTDFGLSKDISDLSHSATDGADRGTFRYMAPEITKYQPHGRAADVFSLACVLFEMFSVWRGFSVDDADSFSALAPFHMNLSAIHSWIGGELAPITPLSLLRYKNSQSIFGSMFNHDPVDRPQIREVVFKMTMVSYPGDLFCNRCLGVVLRRSEAP
ncbi:Serine/threonine-protein kinase TIO [Lasiodiplodia hormozganensis]|nr:Serine/threonine-protein kinase TIO [Lasiodiplodia hormozganensis]